MTDPEAHGDATETARPDGGSAHHHRVETGRRLTTPTSALLGSEGLGTRGRRGLAILVLVALAALVRVVPLYWSQHPATLDGFAYAWRAKETLLTGSYPLGAFRADSFVYTGLIATVSSLLGVEPLRITQPLSSLVGVGGVVTGLAIASHVAREYDWPRRRIAAAVVTTGVILAFDGIFLRRTMVADEEVMAYVLVPLTLLVLHAWLQNRRHGRRWGLLAGVFLGTLPLLHVMSTLVAGLSLLGLVTAHIVRTPTRRTVLGGGAMVTGFWLYFGAYYFLAIRFLSVPYVDRVTAFPGLFLAWVFILLIGVAWAWTTTSRARIAAVALPVCVFYLVVVANVFISVYPGTPQTPILVLVPVLALLVPILAGAVGIAHLDIQRPGGAVVLGLLSGPVALVGFSLTASLTPEYVNTAIRAQTFGHPPIAILAGLVVAGVLGYGPVLDTASRLESATPSGPSAVGVVLVVLIVVATVGSLPFAYLVLDTGAYPSTTLDSEFEGVAFADSTERAWATDHSLSRVGSHYFRSDTSVSPTASWLSGGASPTCPVLSQESWTTTGAHLFPFAPETVSENRYNGWLDSRHVVYANTGRDPVTVSLATTDAQGC